MINAGISARSGAKEYSAESASCANIADKAYELDDERQVLSEPTDSIAVFKDVTAARLDLLNEGRLGW